VGKEERSLDDLFMFREFEKSLKETPGGSFFVYPYRSKKEIKVYLDGFSCICEHEKEQRLSSVCPQLDS
jgi:ATP-dependent helicase/DNAse subunit B